MTCLRSKLLMNESWFPQRLRIDVDRLAAEIVKWKPNIPGTPDFDPSLPFEHKGKSYADMGDYLLGKPVAITPDDFVDSLRYLHTGV